MISAWYKAAFAELETYSLVADIHVERRKEISQLALIGFHELFLQLAKELGIKDEWVDQRSIIDPSHTGITERSRKMGTVITLGIGADGWSIESTLWREKLIRHMTDEFWGHVYKLATIGKAKRHDIDVPARTPEDRKLAKHQASFVFSLARDYILLEKEPCEPFQQGGPTLGWIEVTLPLESDEAKVRQFFKDGIQSLYRINYLLHRVVSQSLRRRIKEEGITEPQATNLMSSLGAYELRPPPATGSTRVSFASARA